MGSGSNCVVDDDDKNSPSTAGISTVAIVGIAIGGIVLLSVIGAAAIDQHRGVRLRMPPRPRSWPRGCRDGRTGRGCATGRDPGD